MKRLLLTELQHEDHNGFITSSTDLTPPDGNHMHIENVIVGESGKFIEISFVTEADTAPSWQKGFLTGKITLVERKGIVSIFCSEFGSRKCDHS